MSVFDKSALNEFSSKKLTIDSSIVLVVKIVNIIIQFILQILLARILGVSEYGSYMFALAWVNILVVIGKLGFDMSALKFVPIYHSSDNKVGLVRFVSFSTRIVLLISICTSALVMLSLLVWGNMLSQSQYGALMVALIGLPLWALLHVHGAIVRGLGSILRGLLPFSIIRHLVLIAILVSMSFHDQLVSAISAHIYTLISLVVALFFLLIIEYLEIKKKNNEDRNFKIEETKWLQTSIPMLFIGLFQVVIAQSDVIMVNMMTDSESGGVYAAMVQISQVMLIGLLSVNTVIAPIISKLFLNNNIRKLQNVMTLASRIGFAITLLIGVVIAIFFPLIISMYGPEFISGGIVLTILSVGHLINSFSGSVGYLMNMTGNQIITLYVLGASFIINIVLNIIFISIYGMLGAAISTAITTIIWNLILVTRSWKKLSIDSTVLGRVL